MNDQPNIIPRVAVRGIASGLLLMAFFTMLWTGIAQHGLNGSDHYAALAAFSLLSIYFIANAVRLFKVSHQFPELSTDADKEEAKRSGKWFGIIFAAEGLGIFIAVNIVTNIGHPDLVIPVIALVVGLHFYPMAKLFRRVIDYYLATWTCIIAICGIIFTLNKVLTVNAVIAFVGVGLAIATSMYGLYMAYSGKQLTKTAD